MPASESMALARYLPACGIGRSSGRSARWRPCPTASEQPGCCRSISASCPSIAALALWRAAMRWGQQHQAAYQLLQTEVGGASDRLCQSEGLTDLGLVCASIL